MPVIWVIFLQTQGKKVKLEPEVPGSLVPESKLRNSRFKSRIQTGIGIKISAIRRTRNRSQKYCQSRNQNRKRNISSKSYSHIFCCFYTYKCFFSMKMVQGPGIGIEIPEFPNQDLESVSKSESSFLHVQSRNRIRNRVQGIEKIRTENIRI